MIPKGLTQGARSAAAATGSGPGSHHLLCLIQRASHHPPLSGSHLCLARMEVQDALSKGR